MNIDIVLDRSRYVRLHEKVVLPDTITLKFSSYSYELPELLVTVRSPSGTKQYKTRDGTVDISELADRAGKIEIVAGLIVKGTEVKKWQVEPIILVEIPQGFEAIPEIVAIEETLRNHESRLNGTALYEF